MRSIELHVMETDTDLDSGVLAGLLDNDELDGVECSACYEDVGHVNGVFYAFAVVLDDVDQWYVCTSCSSNVLNPTDVSSIEDIFSADEEFDEFELDTNE